MSGLPRNQILVGDALDRLRQLPTASVDTAITSPPYFQLRDYGVPGQLGLEPTVTAWVENLRLVLNEVGRVLKPTGSLWLDLGDSYSRHHRYGAPPKGLLLAPERLLLALAADGWIVRNKIVWAKRNPMPSSVADRLNATFDVVYFLVRSRRYYFDLDSIRQPHRSRDGRRARTEPPRPAGWAGPLAGSQDGLRRARENRVPGHWLGKNPGDVWSIAGSRYRGAHFATFPEAIVERPLLASCPAAICTACDRPWKRPVTVQRLGTVKPAGDDAYVKRYPANWQTLRLVGALEPACGCRAATQPGVVLDPFFGSGTVGVVAARLGRDWIGIELNPDYVRMAEERLQAAVEPVPPRQGSRRYGRVSVAPIGPECERGTAHERRFAEDTWPSRRCLPSSGGYRGRRQSRWLRAAGPGVANETVAGRCSRSVVLDTRPLGSTAFSRHSRDHFARDVLGRAETVQYHLTSWFDIG